MSGSNVLAVAHAANSCSVYNLPNNDDDVDVDDNKDEKNL